MLSKSGHWNTDIDDQQTEVQNWVLNTRDENMDLEVILIKKGS